MNRIPVQETFLFPNTKEHDNAVRDYEAGLRWDVNWMPGGPHVYKRNVESRECHKAWLRGFNKGLEERLINDPSFAKWMEERKDKPYCRYYPVAIAA